MTSSRVGGLADSTYCEYQLVFVIIINVFVLLPKPECVGQGAERAFCQLNSSTHHLFLFFSVDNALLPLSVLPYLVLPQLDSSRPGVGL